MASLARSLLSRLVLIALGVYAIVLPVLFYSLLLIVRQSHAEMFVDQVRTHSVLLAQTFDGADSLGSRKRVLDLLDNAVLSGYVTYAELIRGETRVVSSLSVNVERDTYEEDFEFDQNEDRIYYVSQPIRSADKEITILRLGFDEQPTIDSIAEVQARVINVLGVFLGISLVLVMLLSIRLVRPIHALQGASRKIASGQYSEHLEVDSGILELNELAKDLEFMRSELVGINLRLESEISERKIAEKKKAELEEQLRYAQRLESVGTLAGGIAHEFNNILQPIILYTEMAIDDLPERLSVRSDLERVIVSARRARDLVQQILTFSRQAEQEAFELVNLGELVTDTLEMMRALMPANVEVQTEIDMHCAPVLAAAFQLHQVVVNLCNNATQAIGKKSGLLKISVSDIYVNDSLARIHPNLGSGHWVKLSIMDNGQGMDQLTMGRMFEPFYTTRGIGEGTGLGLSVVHGIVTAHHGEVVVTTAIDEGTVIDIYLPVADTENEETAGAGVMSSDETASKQGIGHDGGKRK
jgi:signal transduction histidine kinase